MDAPNQTQQNHHGIIDAAPPRVLVMATHPIQYQVPLFQALAHEPSITLEVLFAQLPDAQQQGTGFGVAFTWDIPLLEGYQWHQVPNLRGKGGLRGFFSTRIHRPLGLLRTLKPDVLILTGWQAWPLLQMLVAARFDGVPVIMRGESNALRQRPWYALWLHRLLLGLCQAFLTIGKANRAFYNSYGVTSARMFTAPYYIDNARFASTAIALQPKRTALRQRWLIPTDTVCFLFAGKLASKKRIMDLLAALQLAVPMSKHPLHLLVVGTGDQMPQAKAFVAQHGLPVTFSGFLNQTEMPAAYVATDCLVLPSDFGETWGLVVNEAMACGKPALISNRVGCGPDLITDGQTGAIFPFADVPALAGKLVALAAEPDHLAAMGQRACRLVHQDYSVERAVTGALAAVRYVSENK